MHPVPEVLAIVFTEDAVLIEYRTPDDTSFPIQSQIAIPYREAQRHQQVDYDLKELISDADNLLASAMLARMKAPSKPTEMGRE